MPVARFVGGPLDGQTQVVNSSTHLFAWIPPRIARERGQWWSSINAPTVFRALQLAYTFVFVERNPLDEEDTWVLRIEERSEQLWRNALTEAGITSAAAPRVFVDSAAPSWAQERNARNSDAIEMRVRTWANVVPPAIDATFPVEDTIPRPQPVQEAEIVRRAPRTPDQLLGECEERRIQIRYYLGTGNIQVREGLELRSSVGDPREVEDALIELLGVTEEERGAFRRHVSTLLDRWAVSAAGREGRPLPSVISDDVYRQLSNVRLDSQAAIVEFPTRTELEAARHPDGWEIYRTSTCGCRMCDHGRWAVRHPAERERILDNII